MEPGAAACVWGWILPDDRLHVVKQMHDPGVRLEPAPLSTGVTQITEARHLQRQAGEGGGPSTIRGGRVFFQPLRETVGDGHAWQANSPDAPAAGGRQEQ